MLALAFAFRQHSANNALRAFLLINGSLCSSLNAQSCPAAASPQALSPRQLQILASASASEGKAATAASTGKLMQEIPRKYMMRRLGAAMSRSHSDGAAPAGASLARGFQTCRHRCCVLLFLVDILQRAARVVAAKPTYTDGRQCRKREHGQD